MQDIFSCNDDLLLLLNVSNIIVVGAIHAAQIIFSIISLERREIHYGNVAAQEDVFMNT